MACSFDFITKEMSQTGRNISSRTELTKPKPQLRRERSDLLTSQLSPTGGGAGYVHLGICLLRHPVEALST